MQLLIATRNRHKLDEIRAIFRVKGLELASAADFPQAPEVVEDGDTFEANAVKKAVALARATGLWTLADDSGLEVDALGGAPGVISARYAGEPVDPAANNRKLLLALSGRSDRRARFRCAIALASPSGTARTVLGDCEGAIALGPRGDGGFGYDPLFVPAGHQETFAEMDAGRKNLISHRGRALEKAAAAWSDLLARSPVDWPHDA
jgi:XTP/dITP diphosphohydrolase